MAKALTYQAPLRLEGAAKRATRTQFGALCFRGTGKTTEVLLIKSLETRRWIIPKGWPMDGLTPSDAAAQEAWEEAGVKGKSREICLGLYSYMKALEDKVTLPVLVAVFPVEVRKLADDYPEAGQRKRKWFRPKKAAARVREPELKHMLRNFDAKALR
ncbi:MAG: NUDIX hydrolase [Pseudomonadota bacterium]